MKNTDDVKRYYEQHLAELPEGVLQAVGKILARHRGAEHQISRRLLVELAAVALNTPLRGSKQVANYDRKVRRAIEVLRGRGWLIGNWQGEGYFLIETSEEYDQFREIYTSRAFKLLKTTRRMDDQAERLFGAAGARQLALME